MRNTLEQLFVYDDCHLIGVITREENGEYWFQYDAEWIKNERAYALAIALPLRQEPFTFEETRNFFDQPAVC